MKSALILTMVKLLFLLWCPLVSNFIFANNYKIDTKNAHASIIFSIRHLNVGSVTGRFDKFKGDFIFDSKNFMLGAVNVTVETYSISTNHLERDNYLRSNDFLNVVRYPLASFVSNKVVMKDQDNFDIIGGLTLNGVTKNIVINAKKTGEGQDPWGGYRVGFEGVTELKLKDFNINFFLGPGSESVKLLLSIEGIRE